MPLATQKLPELCCVARAAACLFTNWQRERLIPLNNAGNTQTNTANLLILYSKGVELDLTVMVINAGVINDVLTT